MGLRRLGALLLLVGCGSPPAGTACLTPADCGGLACISGSCVELTDANFDAARADDAAEPDAEAIDGASMDDASAMDGALDDGAVDDAATPDTGMSDAGGVTTDAGARCPPLASRPRVDVTSDIVTDTTWDCAHLWYVTTDVDVDGPGTSIVVLTVEPGTVVVFGEEDTDGPGALLVSREGRLRAEGTATDPIVFTSAQPVGTRESGDWGGIAMSGRARLNTPGGEGAINALGSTGSAATICGGGATPDDSWECGHLRYVRIEFSGATVDGAADTLAALTLGGCGTGTVIDHVELHRPRDDGLTIYGGRVDLGHVVVSASEEDTLDWNLGWDGRVQFFVAWQLSSAATGHTAEAIFTGDSEDRTPRSAPTMFNVTALGAVDASNDPVYFGSATEGRLANTVIHAPAAGYNIIEVCDASTAANATAGSLRIASSVLTDRFALPDGCSDGSFVERSWACVAGVACDAALSVSFGADVTRPSFALPAPMRAMCTAVPTDPADGRAPFFDASATFCGAVGATDWTAGWTEFPAS